MVAAVIEHSTKQVVDVFIDFKGKILKGEVLFKFPKSAYEPNIFFDSKRKEFYFMCTVESGGLSHPDLKSGLQMIFLTKLKTDGTQARKSTKIPLSFVGYTNNSFAKTSGYYNKHTDR